MEYRVLDSDGQALVAYHGTDAEFARFWPSTDGYFGRARIYFTDSKQAANKFVEQYINGGHVVAAFLSMANPYRVDFDEHTDDVTIEELEARGFDGVIMETETIEGLPDTMYVVFRPEQVIRLDLINRCQVLIAQGKVADAVREYSKATGVTLQRAQIALCVR